MTTNYALCYGNGTSETYDTYAEACAAYLASRTHGEIYHGVDNGPGESSLCWPSAELATDDDGSRADARIRQIHVGAT